VPNSSQNGGQGHTDNNGAGMVNICQLKGAIYWTSGMAVDCDGLADNCTNGLMLGSVNAQHCPGDDPTNQGQTSFNNAAGMSLSAGLIPYIVISQDVTNVMGLDNSNMGGNVVAVIYNNKLIFAVFGDQGPVGRIGESSYMTAASLGINPDPNSGGTAGPVTFIVFTGAGAVPQDLGNPLEAWQIGLPLAQQVIANNP
jgi:Fungal chitosanase of glycosyl hydrolase group 75